MTVLVANDETSISNPFISELNMALRSAGVLVTSSTAEFWKCTKPFDIVHFHWPEYLVDCSSISKFIEVIDKWKSCGTKIVWTRHDHKSYTNNMPPDYFLPYVDGVIHLGDFSLKNVQNQINWKHLFHVVVPHHVYQRDLLLHQSTPTDDNIKFILCPGQIRSRQERRLINHVKEFLKAEKIELKIPSWNLLYARPTLKTTPLAISKIFSRLFQRMILDETKGHKVLSEVELAKLSNDCMAILIPRIDALNSGLITHGFAYSKTVIGPNVGNIGELLKSTGNPTFDPTDFDSIITGIITGIKLSTTKLGQNNHQFAKQHLMPDQSASKHIEFYRELTK